MAQAYNLGHRIKGRKLEVQGCPSYLRSSLKNQTEKQTQSHGHLFTRSDHVHRTLASQQTHRVYTNTLSTVAFNFLIDNIQCGVWVSKECFPSKDKRFPHPPATHPLVSSWLRMHLSWQWLSVVSLLCIAEALCLMPCTESRGGGEPAIRMHACNSSTQKAKARGLLRVRGQPGLHSKTIPQNRRKQPHPKLKTNRKRREENWGHKRRDQTLHHWVYKSIYTCWTKGTQEQNYIAFLLTCVSKVILFCFVVLWGGSRVLLCNLEHLPQSPKGWHEPPQLPFLF